MDRDDEKLTLENVDEQIEQYLSQPRTSTPETENSLARTTHNLHDIYDEKRRLEQAWARINNHILALNNNHILALNTDNDATLADLSTIRPAQEDAKAGSTTVEESTHPILHLNRKRSQKLLHWNRRLIGITIAAAVVLLAIFLWPTLSYALYGTLIGHPPPSTDKGTPQSQATADMANMKVYSSQYFTIQYPANWIVTRVTMGGSSQQTVQFRPSATSTMFVTIDVLHNTTSSAAQLLKLDPELKMGSGLSTRSVVTHGMPWIVGVVDLPASAHAQAGKREVAYANQKIPYRIEFGSTTDKFDIYMPVFNSMFASFQAQNMPLATATATATATSKPGITPTATAVAQATPSPTSATPIPTNIASLKLYNGQYFTIQYPANWIITNITTGGTYQQTVQLRPSATSAASVTIDVLNNSALTADQLLNIDPDLKLGTQLSTSSATYGGIPWKIGTVTQLATVLNPASKTEVAYSNQKIPYKIEFNATPDMFDTYTPVFNNLLASFKPAG